MPVWKAVVLTVFLHQEVRQHLAWFAEKGLQALVFVGEKGPHGLVFVGEKGTPFRRTSFDRK
ncbi:hypothetical protein ACFZCL_37105 [Streptomyces sp. NPDC008159]|uniref:hypothetical protein n=1 Tax=Streptomyces sp. NPDC008159 TaxID=3364817 RepID=UPI0036E94AA6